VPRLVAAARSAREVGREHEAQLLVSVAEQRNEPAGREPEERQERSVARAVDCWRPHDRERKADGAHRRVARHERRTVAVDATKLRQRGRPHQAGQMIDDLRAGHERGARERAVEIPVDEPAAQRPEDFSPRRAADERGHRIPAVDQGLGEVSADEAGRTGESDPQIALS
jgi:hypothetical protein